MRIRPRTPVLLPAREEGLRFRQLILEGTVVERRVVEPMIVRSPPAAHNLLTTVELLALLRAPRPTVRLIQAGIDDTAMYKGR
jgi:hypothetical protein